MKALKRKAASQKGASITFALLLFLVCAIISSVVIVAATAAAGRMSQRAEIDQRYYAVNSAAGLLRDDFEDKIVTVQYKQNISKDEMISEPHVINIKDRNSPSTPLAATDCPILAHISEFLVDKVVQSSKYPDPTAADNTYTLTVTGPTSDKAALDCTIEEYIRQDRNQLVFKISNAPPAGETGGKLYTLLLTLNASVSQTTSETETTTSSGTEKISTVTTKIEWKLGNLQKGTVIL